MATADPRTILKIPARLVADPTDLSADFPHGGTALGISANVLFRVISGRLEVLAEEFGNERVETITTGENVLVGAFVRGFDMDMLTKVFEDTSTGAGTGGTVIEYPGATRAGTTASTRGFKLLIAPDNTEGHPALLIYNAVPLIEESVDMQFNTANEFGVSVVFQGIRDGSSRVYAMGIMEDLTL